MIQKTFLFLDRVGKKTEEKLWKKDIHDWQCFKKEDSIPGFGTARKKFCDRCLDKAEAALEDRDIEYFSSEVPDSHHWRLFNEFDDEVVYLDIETTGLHGDITVIGLYNGEDTHFLVRNANLNKASLKKALSEAKLLVTFNGASFDLPVIEKYFSEALPDIPHIDLRHVCRKIGLTGGLKKIEEETGISRRSDVKDVDGYEAVILWKKYRATGKKKYLEKLIKYNEADIKNLEPLAELAVNKIWGRTRKFKNDSSLPD